MGKFWSVIFLLVPIFGVLAFVVAPMYQHWLPRDVSEHGAVVDHLFRFILVLTGVVFIITEGVLFWFLWKYDGGAKPAAVKFMHGSHTLEVVWTILPAATLLFIAIYQLNAWASIKIDQPKIKPTVEVTARQFEWRLRYPDQDGNLGTSRDLFTVNEMHIPVNTPILVELKSQDVLHSFFLPNLRIKQDAVPGMKQPVWFTAKEVGQYDLVCAQLCGWGHYKMMGRLIVESPEDYQAFLKRLRAEQEATQEKPLEQAAKKGSE